MKAVIAAILFVFIASVLSIIVVNNITGSLVYKENPCYIVNCTVRLFGFIKTEAEYVRDDEDGLAMCHCPQDPQDDIYRISHWTKY